MKAITDKAKQLFGLLQTEEIKDEATLLQVCQDVARNQLKRDTLMLQRDAAMQLVKDEHDAGIEQVQAVVDHDVKRLKTWATANRVAKFGQRQSFVIAGHLFEFHKGTGAVKCADELTEADVVDRIMALDFDKIEDPTLRSLGLDFTEDEVKSLLLSVEASLNKVAVKREFRLSKLKGLLEWMGLRILQGESFTFTPAREELPSIAESSTSSGAVGAGGKAAA